MKNDVILKKDSFPKTISEASHVLSKWRNNYCRKYNNGKNCLVVVLPLQLQQRKKKRKSTQMTRKKKSPVSNAKRKGIISTNAWRN